MVFVINEPPEFIVCGTQLPLLRHPARRRTCRPCGCHRPEGCLAKQQCECCNLASIDQHMHQSTKRNKENATTTKKKTRTVLVHMMLSPTSLRRAAAECCRQGWAVGGEGGGEPRVTASGDALPNVGALPPPGSGGGTARKRGGSARTSYEHSLLARRTSMCHPARTSYEHESLLTLAVRASLSLHLSGLVPFLRALAAL